VYKTIFFLKTYQNVYFNISTGTEEAVEVLKIKNTWMGVVCEEDIAADEMVKEYVGEVIRSSVADER